MGAHVRRIAVGATLQRLAVLQAPIERAQRFLLAVLLGRRADQAAEVLGGRDVPPQSLQGTALGVVQASVGAIR